MTRVNDRTASKSARKREHLLLQALGEKLIALPVSDLETMQLDESLFSAVVDAKSMRSHGALRRQRQLIGKLMRDADAARIETTLDFLGRADRAGNAVFHAAEEWRDRICAEGAPALAAFAEHRGRDTAALARMLRELEGAAGESAERRIRRRLFRAVHAELEELAKENEENS